MRLIIAQDKEAEAGLIVLPVQRVEERLDDFMAWGELLGMSVGSAESLERQGFDGPYVLLLCDDDGTILGKASAGLPVLRLWEFDEDESGTPAGYLTGNQKWWEFAGVVGEWITNPRPIGSVALR